MKTLFLKSNTRAARLKFSRAACFCAVLIVSTVAPLSKNVGATQKVESRNEKVEVKQPGSETFSFLPSTFYFRGVHPSSLILHPLHKFYVSFAQVEWNAETKSLEISVRVFADDLELALQRANNRNGIFLDKTSDVDKLLLAYLQQRLEIKDAKGESVKLSWVGKELNVDSVWLYVEAAMPQGLSQAQARSSLFFELYPDQINTMSFKQADKRNDATWKRGDDWQTVFESK